MVHRSETKTRHRVSIQMVSPEEQASACLMQERSQCGMHTALLELTIKVMGDIFPAFYGKLGLSHS